MESLVGYLNFDIFTTTRVILLVLLSILSGLLVRSVTPSKEKSGKPVPGPIGLPIVGYLPFLGKDASKTLKEMSNKYGNLIGLHLGRNYTVVLNEYKVAKEVLGHPGAQDRAPDLFEYISSSGFHMKNGEEWIEQRRFCRSATRDIGLGRGHWEDLIMEETINLMEKIKATGGKGVDISYDLSVSILSNILSLIIGRRLTEDQEKMQLAVNYIDVCLNYIGPEQAGTLFPKWRKFCEIFKISGYHKASLIILNFSSLIREEINRHKNSGTYNENEDFINMYLAKMSEMENVKTGNHFFSEPMLHGNVIALLVGASDTILKSVSWLLRLMAAYKDIQEKVYIELIESIGKEGRARYQERHKFPYTFATVMEGQRFSSILRLSTSRNFKISLN